MKHDDERTSIQYIVQARNKEITTQRIPLSEGEQRKDKGVHLENDSLISDVVNKHYTVHQQRCVKESKGQRLFQTVPKKSLLRKQSPEQSFATMEERLQWNQDDLSTSVVDRFLCHRPESYQVVSRMEPEEGRYYSIFSSEHSFQRSSMTTTSQSSSFLSQQESKQTASPYELRSTSLQHTTKDAITNNRTRSCISNELKEEVSQRISQPIKKQEETDEEERKRMRLIKNRASAERSRRRQRERLEELIYEVKSLRQENIYLKQDHLSLLGYIDHLKTCMRQNGISVEAIPPMPSLSYPSSKSFIEHGGEDL